MYQATGSRQIPRQRNEQSSGGIVKSSLDIVWSYSRSQAYFGSNLPSSPSFVARYRRPSIFEEDDSDSAVQESDVPNEEQSVQTIESATDDDGAIDETDELEGEWEIHQPQRSQSTSTGRGRLASTTGKQKQASHRTSNQSLSWAPSLNKHPSETSSLLEKKNRPASVNQPLSPGADILSCSPVDSIPFANPSPLLKNQLQHQNKASQELKAQLVAPAHGQSTYGQTLFNSVNILVGVGILAEPLAFAYAGWFLGSLLLLFCGLATNYTAKILARIMAEDETLSTYQDIGTKAFGKSARILISVLFCLELSALSVALVVLFGDSLHTLFPDVSSMIFKLVGFAIIIPTIFLPLRFLSITSLLGIISTITLTFMVIIDGAVKSAAPGSLRHPMPTDLGPHWMHMPLAFGLIMGGFAGHAVMPNIYKDMRDPTKFCKMIDTAYIISGLLYGVMAIFGYLMFGRYVHNEITVDLMATPGYPQALNKIAVWTVAINPICKFAVSTRPLNTTIDYLLGLEGPTFRRRPSHALLRKASYASSFDESGLRTPKIDDRRRSSTFLSPSRSPTHFNNNFKAILRIIVKLFVTALVTFIAIIFPGFDRVMSFLGAFSAFIICIIGPVSAKMVLFGSDMSRTEWVIDSLLLVSAVTMATSGTIFSFIPLRPFS